MPSTDFCDFWRIYAAETDRKPCSDTFVTSRVHGSVHPNPGSLRTEAPLDSWRKRGKGSASIAWVQIIPSTFLKRHFISAGTHKNRSTQHYIFGRIPVRWTIFHIFSMTDLLAISSTRGFLHPGHSVKGKLCLSPASELWAQLLNPSFSTHPGQKSPSFFGKGESGQPRTLWFCSYAVVEMGFGFQCLPVSKEHVWNQMLIVDADINLYD